MLYDQIKRKFQDPAMVSIQTEDGKYQTYYHGRFLKETGIPMVPVGDEEDAEGVVAYQETRHGQPVYRVTHWTQDGQVDHEEIWDR